jgi:hypothetical protein
MGLDIKGCIDVIIIGFAIFPLDGKHRNLMVLYQGCRYIILGAEGV